MSDISRPPETAGEPWRSIPGPIERESFFAAQARNRRATWRLGALCLLAALLMGIPLSVVVSPLVWLLVFVANDIVNRVVPTPDLLRLLAHAGEPGGLALPQPIATAAGIAALIVPGMVSMALAWLAGRALFLRAGVGGVLLSLGAREPSERRPRPRAPPPGRPAALRTRGW